MSLHIHRFIDSIKAHESRNQRDFTMTMNEARDLHADITKLLLCLHELSVAPPKTAEITTVELAGGSF